MSPNNSLEKAEAIAPAADYPDTGTTAYEDLRRRHLEEMQARVPEHFERLTWSAERLRSEQEARLRTLVRAARDRSPWHRERLADVDPGELTEDDLPELPVMTKHDLMEHFDEIVTDPRLTLEKVEAHLESLTGDAYLLDRYHAVASSGSSGYRGVFVYDWQSWADCWLGSVRYVLREMLRGSGSARRGPMVMAVVASGHPTHMGSSLPRTFSNPAAMATCRFPVTLPLGQIVAGLNDVRPDVLTGYPSALHQLVFEARAGMLEISPRVVVSVAEPLLPEIRAALQETWAAPVYNWWSCSEGGQMGSSCGRGRGLHLSDDLLIIEPVDARGRAAPPGVRSAKVYLTNLYNPTLPLIRYELTDEITLLEEPCPCGSAHRLVEDIQGRLDDTFIYPQAGAVHPHVFRSHLGRERNIVEYQVRQTAGGAAIAIRCGGEVDVASLRTGIASDLVRLGLEKPEVSVTPVKRLERQASGKLKRFVPLADGSR
jgi:phenylacetate-coenzyme A ligase PaaK-like adenylate-forming protein